MCVYVTSAHFRDEWTDGKEKTTVHSNKSLAYTRIMNIGPIFPQCLPPILYIIKVHIHPHRNEGFSKFLIQSNISKGILIKKLAHIFVKKLYLRLCSLVSRLCANNE